MTEIYKRTAAFFLPQSPTSQATSDCRNRHLNVLPASSMITPAFLFTLLLLGYCQAITIKAQSEELSSKPFVITIDPGFEVTGAKLGETKLGICVDPAPQSKKVTPCYMQTFESMVKFLIADKSKWEKAEFMVGTVAKATYTMDQLTPVASPEQAGPAVQDNKIQNDAFHLPFIPTGMQLIPKKATSSEQQQRPAQTGATDPVPVTKKCSEQQAESDNCFEVVTANYLVFVLAEMSSTPQVLTFTGVGDKEFQTTFFQGSAAAWLSHSVALILANLAIVYFAY